MLNTIYVIARSQEYDRPIKPDASNANFWYERRMDMLSLAVLNCSRPKKELTSEETRYLNEHKPSRLGESPTNPHQNSQGSLTQYTNQKGTKNVQHVRCRPSRSGCIPARNSPASLLGQ